MSLFEFTKIIVLITLTSVFSYASTHGTLMVVKGEVVIQSVKDNKNVKARIGSKIFEGDTIVTGKDSRAKVVMIDKNVINISPNSKFKIEKYVHNSEENKKEALLNVIYGKVRTTVNQKYDGKNKFQVKTKSSVAGVRGTDFLVQFNQKNNASRIVTFTGKVEVDALGSGGQVLSSVMVEPGQYAVASLNSTSMIARAIPSVELSQLNEQSLADISDIKEPKHEREPSQQQDSAREPDAASPNQGPATGTGAALLNEMGEDISAPANVSMPNLPGMPHMGPGNHCPPSGCNPTNNIDPSLLQGKSNVIINIGTSP